MNRMITRPAGPAGFRCDLDDLLLSFLLSLYDRFAAWASITAGAAEDPLWVDYCRLPDWPWVTGSGGILPVRLRAGMRWN